MVDAPGLSDAQQAVRAQGIGSSEIAAIVGLSPWQSRFDVFNRKIGLVERGVDTNPQRAGRWLEDSVARWAAKRMKWSLRRCNRTLVDRRHRFRVLTPDRFITEQRKRTAIAEIKTAWSDDDWGTPMTDEVPEYYRVQVQWQMGGTRLPVAFIPVFFYATRELRVYRVEHSAALDEALLEAANTFWSYNVMMRVPPPFDDSDGCARYIAATRKQAVDFVAPAPPEAEPWARELAEAKRDAELAARRDQRAQNELRAIVGKHKGIQGDWGRYLWGQTESSGVDWKALAKGLMAATVLGGIATEAQAAALVQAHVRPGARKPRFTPRGELKTIVDAGKKKEESKAA